MSRAPTVVLDTNVVLSAVLFSDGRLAALREAWSQGRCRPLASQATVSELIRALAYPKFQLSEQEQRELLTDYLPSCTTVRMPDKSVRIPACRDSRDRPFLELALVGKADYLVTGDKDILSLAEGFACPIVTAAWLLSFLLAS
jgi:putative PIN family toxin of toxin-antitoxin system